MTLYWIILPHSIPNKDGRMCNFWNIIEVFSVFGILARLAQSVEHETLNLRVVGSSPTLGDHFFIFCTTLILCTLSVTIKNNFLKKSSLSMNRNCFTLGLLRQKIKAFSAAAEAKGGEQLLLLWLRERQPWTSPEVRQKKSFFLAFLFFAVKAYVMNNRGCHFRIWQMFPSDDGDINRTAPWNPPHSVFGS